MAAQKAVSLYWERLSDRNVFTRMKAALTIEPVETKTMAIDSTNLKALDTTPIRGAMAREATGSIFTEQTNADLALLALCSEGQDDMCLHS